MKCRNTTAIFWKWGGACGPWSNMFVLSEFFRDKDRISPFIYRMRVMSSCSPFALPQEQLWVSSAIQMVRTTCAQSLEVGRSRQQNFALGQYYPDPLDLDVFSEKRSQSSKWGKWKGSLAGKSEVVEDATGGQTWWLSRGLISGCKDPRRICVGRGWYPVDQRAGPHIWKAWGSR
jgi:hypothetical protein